MLMLDLNKALEMGGDEAGKLIKSKVGYLEPGDLLRSCNYSYGFLRNDPKGQEAIIDAMVYIVGNKTWKNYNESSSLILNIATALEFLMNHNSGNKKFVVETAKDFLNEFKDSAHFEDVFKLYLLADEHEGGKKYLDEVIIPNKGSRELTSLYTSLTNDVVFNGIESYKKNSVLIKKHIKNKNMGNEFKGPARPINIKNQEERYYVTNETEKLDEELLPEIRGRIFLDKGEYETIIEKYFYPAIDLAGKIVGRERRYLVDQTLFEEEQEEIKSNLLIQQATSVGSPKNRPMDDALRAKISAHLKGDKTSKDSENGFNSWLNRMINFGYLVEVPSKEELNVIFPSEGTLRRIMSPRQ